MCKRLLYPIVLAVILVNVFYAFCAFPQGNADTRKIWMTEIMNELEINKQWLMFAIAS